MKQFLLPLGLFLVLTSVNCFQNKRKIDNDRGYLLTNELARDIIPWIQPARQFAKAGLAAHNKKRLSSPHYGTRLVLDEKLCKDAQRYADKLARRDSGLQHAGATGQGENLSGPNYGWVTAESVVEGWYREKETGGSCKQHYTQMVWKKSVRFCMATAVSRSGGFYTVARYFPAGNIAGARNYQENVSSGFKNPCSGIDWFQPPRPSNNTPKPSIHPYVATTEAPSDVSVISANPSGFSQAGIEAHNKRRHTSPHYGTSLILDDKLCRGAQNYAEILARRNSGLQHSKRNTRPGQGENITYYKQRTVNGKPVGRVDAEFFVQGWYSEKDTGEKCMGHYTALVWKKSVKSCMAFATSRDGAYYVVARYSPAGNVQGNKNYNDNVHPGFVYPC